MPFNHTLAGTTFTESNFQGNAYANESTGLPKALEKTVEHVANAFRGTASDSVTVGTGSKNFTTTNANNQIPAFAVGMPVRIARTSDPSGTYMQGEITAWDGATGQTTINVDATKGSGTFSDWTVVIGGHQSVASGVPPLTVNQGGTGATGEKGALANLLPAISGVVESTNFVQMALFGPAHDAAYHGINIDWTLHTDSPAAQLMVVTLHDTGSDTNVDIWDATDPALIGGTPLATLTLTSTNCVQVTTFGPWICVSSDVGVRVIGPFIGSWAESVATSGGFSWPHSVTTSTDPTAANNTILDACLAHRDGSSVDPRWGGPLPDMWWSANGTREVFQADGGKKVINGGTGDIKRQIVVPGRGIAISPRAYTECYISKPLEIAAGGSESGFWSRRILDEPSSMTSAAPWNSGAWSVGPQSVGYGQGKFVVGCASSGMTFVRPFLGLPSAGITLAARINQARNTGYLASYTAGAWLVDSGTSDRSSQGNNLTAQGTPPSSAAVETGAEQLGWGPFTGGNYYREDTSSSDFDFTSIQSFSCVMWVKLDGNESANDFFGYVDGAYSGTSYWRMMWQTNSDPAFHINDDGSISNYAYGSEATYGTGAVNLNDGEWHLLVGVCDRNTDGHRMYVDGRCVYRRDGMSIGGFVNTAAKVGVGQDGGNNYPTTKTHLSCVRVFRCALQEQHVEFMYEEELPKYQASAKCLLQHASSHDTPDLSVDPITGKVLSTQSTNQEIWKGLAVETERTIASGGTTFQHGLLFGDDVFEINDANLYANIAAKDLRGDLELMRGMMAADMPGVDLSKAKAWVIQQENGTTPAITASYNIESLTRLNTGEYEVYFSTPFKSYEYGAGGGANPGYVGIVNGNYYTIAYVHVDGLITTPKKANIKTNYHDGTAYNSKFMAVFFGELENE